MSEHPPSRHAHHSTESGLPSKGHQHHSAGGKGAHGGHANHHEHMVADFRKRFWISVGLSIPVIALAPMIQGLLGLGDTLAFGGSGWVSAALSSIVFFYGGWPFLKGFVGEIGKRAPGMMTLISVAITAAYAYSIATVFGLAGEPFFWELVTLIDIMLVGHWIEMKSVMGASKALEELARLMPNEAHRVLDDGSIVDVPVESLQSGWMLQVRPGEKLPADGEVVAGTTDVNEAMLTGESVPVQKTPGDFVIGGSVNGEGALTLRVTATGEGTFLSQVIQLVRDAQESRSRTQDLANRAAVWLTGLALVGGASTFLFWWLLTDQPMSFAIERAVTLMVIACPHALGLAVPLVVAVSTALAAANGLLIRDRGAFESARRIDAIVFDKTGTLTRGEFGVTQVIRLGDPDLTVERLLRIASSLEAVSEHPIAQGIVRSSDGGLPVSDFRAITGKGAQATVDGLHVAVVSPGYLRENELSVDHPEVSAALSRGETVVYVVIEGVLKGAIALADIVRPESKAAIARFKQMGIRCMMLTGDNAQVAASVAAEVGLDEFFAEVLPHEKEAKIRDVQARGLVVAMTGDGVNDAPALARADVGIAVGAGADVAVESADIVLVSNNPLDVVALVGLARNTYRKMVQNLFWATGYNAIAIPLAAGVLYPIGFVLTPAAGAAFMSLSTVIVAVNARLLRFER